MNTNVLPSTLYISVDLTYNIVFIKRMNYKMFYVNFGVIIQNKEN